MLLPKDIDFRGYQMSYIEFISKFDLRFEIPDTFTPNFHFLERAIINLDCWHRGEINLYGLEDTKETDEVTVNILNAQGANEFLTLFKFIELEEFKIQDFVIATEFNGLSYSELHPRFQRRLKDVTINYYFMYKGLVQDEDIELIEKLVS